MGGRPFIIPCGYEYLGELCDRFYRDHPNYEKNVFVMCRFDSSDSELSAVLTTIRDVLRDCGFNPLLANDRVYPKDRNLWCNVCTYMICSKFGIAVLEDLKRDEFNPNIAIESGFMLALDKSILLLAEHGFKHLRADIGGMVREMFDAHNVQSIRPAIESWLKDHAHQ
jgi:hypothetical protein